MPLFGALVGLPALKAHASLETLATSFESMLGSAGEAAAMVERLTTFSAKTPFQIEGIGRATKSLLAFGVQGDEIVGKLQFLGDIAAGAGVPLADLAQIYGKAMAKGKAQTEELNQMSERGVPILTALVDLAAKYGNEISKEDVYKAAEKRPDHVQGDRRSSETHDCRGRNLQQANGAAVGDDDGPDVYCEGQPLSGACRARRTDEPRPSPLSRT